MSAEPSTPILYTAREAAAILRVCEKTVVAEVKEGRLRYVLVGKRRRFKPADLDAYVNRQGRGWQENDGSRPAAKGRRISTATSPSTVVDFEDALARLMKKKPKS